MEKHGIIVLFLIFAIVVRYTTDTVYIRISHQIYTLR